MVESVDTRDLKSLGHCGCAGSSPASSTEVDANCLIFSSWHFLYLYFVSLKCHFIQLMHFLDIKKRLPPLTWKAASVCDLKHHYGI